MSLRSQRSMMRRKQPTTVAEHSNNSMPEGKVGATHHIPLYKENVNHAIQSSSQQSFGNHSSSMPGRARRKGGGRTTNGGKRKERQYVTKARYGEIEKRM